MRLGDVLPLKPEFTELVLIPIMILCSVLIKNEQILLTISTIAIWVWFRKLFIKNIYTKSISITVTIVILALVWSVESLNSILYLILACLAVVMFFVEIYVVKVPSKNEREKDDN